jgi:DNA-binding FrmR family transcriptional regulator
MNADIKKQLVNRLRTIEGHTRGLERMVEADQYCVDILHQALAIQRALDRVNAIIIENHLQTCVTTAIRGEEPSERERVIHELVALFTGPSFTANHFQTVHSEEDDSSGRQCSPPQPGQVPEGQL